MAVRTMNAEKNDSSVAIEVGKETEKDPEKSKTIDLTCEATEGKEDSDSEKTEEESTESEKDDNNKDTQESSTEEGNKPWPLRDIKEPHANDVLYGRGGGTNHHPGNKRYRQIVEKHKKKYITCKRLEKPNVAIRIIDDWRSQDPPGRFLKQDESTGLWHDVGAKKAREKTSQALREKAPLLKKLEEEKANAAKLRDMRSVSFAKEEPHVGSESKRKPLPLVRDHSLGRDYVKSSENLSLESWSWEKPGQQFGAGVSRQHSLAMNPLQHASVNEPVYPSFLYERPTDGFRRTSSGNPVDNYSNSVTPSAPHTHIRRSSSSERLPTEPDYRTHIYQSWSHGQQDEYVQQKMPPPPQPPQDRYDVYQRPPSRSSSNNSAYGADVQPYDYKPYPQSNTTRPSYPQKDIRRISSHQSSGVVRRSSHSSQDRDYYSFGDTSFENSRNSSNPPPQRSFSNSSQNHYQVNKRTSPSKPYPASTVPPPDGFKDIYPPRSYPYPTNPSPRDPNEAFYNDRFDSNTNSTRNQHRSSSTSSSSHSSHRRKHRYNSGSGSKTGLARPSTVKRNTSNQNEEAETKKETKLIKRPGLNREHSITAQRLKEAQRKKEQEQLYGDYRRQERPNNAFHRQHSLAGHNLTVDDSYLESPPPTTLFSEETGSPKEELIEPLLFKESDLNENLDVEDLTRLDDDIQNISHATKGIDLGNSPNRLQRPATLNIKNRMTTTEFINELVATTATSPDEIFGSLE